MGRLDSVLGLKCGYGGIAVFACAQLADIALAEYITGAERMWCILGTNLTALLIGNWYRPADEDGSSVAICRLRSGVAAVIVLALFYSETLTQTIVSG